MKPMEFVREVTTRHEINVLRYGDQGGLLLVAVLSEEVGEVARAVLDHLKNDGSTTKTSVLRECVDAAAVLMALADEITRWPKATAALPQSQDSHGKKRLPLDYPPPPDVTGWPDVTTGDNDEEL